MSDGPVTQRLQQAAFSLFAEQGYDATSVDQIAARAGVGRTTFFRAFASKEAVIFPDHEEMLARVRARLSTGEVESHFLAIAEAARIVLRHYLEEGDLARARYRLTRTVPALRDREIAGGLRYHHLFREHIRPWLTGDLADLRAELYAAAVVTAHNQVLRHWLRGLTDQPEADFDIAMGEVGRLFGPRSSSAGSRVVVLDSSADVDDVVPLLRRALGPEH